jgi:hypothetical protein
MSILFLCGTCMLVMLTCPIYSSYLLLINKKLICKLNSFLSETLWKSFPKGYLTEEEFVAKFHESEMFGKDNNFSPAKHLFSLIDQNKSGMLWAFSYFYIDLD